MSVRKAIPEQEGIYFITITCNQWMHLFENTDGYNTVYRWFDYLKSKGHYILGYVIMPNHLHALIGFKNTQHQSINTIIGNGKRFMSYEIVKRLEELNAKDILNRLSSTVNSTDRSRGKLHEVFEPSFDWKACASREFITQKLDYIHENPCRGNWNLAEQLHDYAHSSAKYYLTGQQGVYEVTSFTELEDIDLTKV